MTNKINGNIGISPEYVKGWEIEEAIREIVQNYLDSRKEFDCDGYVKWEDGLATVKDYGPGLELRHLVMGISEKGEDSIGQFGEGLKLALLVFAREGREIEIWSNGKRITPEIRYNESFETDLISLSIEELPPHWAANHTGTSIKFECKEEELDDGKSYFLDYFKRSNEEFNWLDKDFASLPGGSVWVNGSKVGEIENSKFSYHLNNKEAKKAINRDRGVVDRDELESIISDRLGKTRALKLITKYLEIIRDEEDCWESDLYVSEYDIQKKNEKLWKRGITRTFGKDFVIASGDIDRDKKAQYEGYHIMSIPSWKHKNLLNHLGVEDTIAVLKNQKNRTKKIAQKDLSKEKLNVLKKAKNLVKNNYNSCGRVKVVEEFKDEKRTTLGVYDREKDVIYIHTSQLENLKEAVDTLLHETVHKHSGYSDCTAEFESALCEIAVNMMLKA